MSDYWHYAHNRPLDMIAMGRVAVDLYSEQIGAALEDAVTFRKYLGGCPGNIAVGSSRLGLKTAMFSCIGTDAMGQFLKKELLREKVDITLLRETSEHLTGLVLLGVIPPDHFPLVFYRENCADMQISKDQVDPDFFAKAKVLLITGTGLSTANMREATHYAVDTAQAVKTRVIFDLDYRPVLWKLAAKGDGETRYVNSESVSSHYRNILPKCDLIVGTVEEMQIAGQAESLEVAINNIRACSAAPIVCKLGAHGCQIFLDDLSKPVKVKAYPTTILNVLGAGDAFISGFMRGLLRNESWETCARYGNAGGAIVVSRHGCAPAMPYYEELMTFIKQCDIKKGNHYERVFVTQS